MEKLVRAVMGLGNPEECYDWSLHNVGHLVVDRLAVEYGVELSKHPVWNALAAEISVGGDPMFLIKPIAGMNDSGQAIAALLADLGKVYYPPLVVFDDLSLPQGKLRFRDSGSAGGHNGLKSVQALMSEHWLLPRLKVGIGPDVSGDKRRDYVLTPLPADRRDEFTRAVIDPAVVAARHWLEHGTQSAMSVFNKKS
jgi:Peptidyl-tRNA hydrolase